MKSEIEPPTSEEFQDISEMISQGNQKSEQKKQKEVEKIVASKDEEITRLKIHSQNLEDQIKKSKNDNKSPYGCDNELEEEIKHLNKLIMEKDVELAQVRMRLENQEAKLCHHKQQKEKLQQQYDDSKKTHKLELTKVNRYYQAILKKFSD